MNTALMLASPLAIALLLAFSLPATAGQVIVDRFDSIEQWTHNEDGGLVPQVSLDAGVFASAPTGMRVVYTEGPPSWGNMRRPFELPANATDIVLRLYKHSSAPNAAMHVWLSEADHDGWVVQVRDVGVSVGAMTEGWHDIKLPLESFSFEPRGARTRDMASVNAIMLGCNFGDLDVTVDDLGYLTRDEGVRGMPPTTEGLTIKRTDRGAVLVLKDDLPRTPGCADPDALAKLLTDAGWGVTLVKAGDLANPAVLANTDVDVLVLPYGPAFPADAAGPLKDYLKRGGGLVCIGGYAFDDLVSYGDGAWSVAGLGLTAAEVSAGEGGADVRLNTRFGRPGDAIGLDPEQLQVFDPSFPLDGVASIGAAPGQSIVPAGFRAELPIEGWSAVSTMGSNSAVFPMIWARRIPLIQAHDSFGRLRGTVGAIVHNYDGPYAGSSWALFGATNADLFTGPDAPLAEFLPAIVEAVARPLYLRGIGTEWACYHQGEDVVVKGEIRCRGELPKGAGVVVELPGLATARVDGLSGTGAVPFKARFRTASFPGDLQPVAAELQVDGRTVDRAETAFVVWDDKVIAGGPRLGISGSYITVGGRPTVLSGTNETGFMWFSEHEDPLVWDRDFTAMRDNGVNVLRILHFSPYSEGGYEGRPTNDPLALANRPEKLLRQTDAIVQLAQKHGVIVFLALHDWMSVSLTDEQYAAQRDWDRFWTARYKDIPGIMYDIQNEPSIDDPPDTPNLRKLYNEILERRYGGPDALKEAWRTDDLGGEWGGVPIRRASGDWSDAAAHDYWLFKMAVYNNWVAENAAGILEGDPDALCTVGNLNSNQNADKQVGSLHLPFTNTHFYGSLEAFSQILKFLDRRWEGKPLSVGEFGAQEAHDQRISGGDGTRDAESVRRFLWFGHYTFGLGGSFLANWSWKDFEGCVFPWGIRYLGDDVSKDVLAAYRAQSLLFRRLTPEYRPPSVYVVQPDSHRFGPMFGQIEGALQSSFAALYHCGVPFGVLGEGDLGRLPSAAKVLIWPVPYCPSDETFNLIERFVRAGGALYVSGDVAFDESRRPAKAERLTKLALPDMPHTEPGATPEEALTKEPLTSQVGDGKVFFVPYPLELRAGDRVLATYRSFLDFAGVKPETPSDPPGQVLRVPLRGGGHADVLAHYSASGSAVAVRSAEYEATLGPLEVALVATDPSGGIVALNVPAGLRDRSGAPLVTGDAHAMALSLTDRPLADTECLLLAPLTPGGVVLNLVGAGRDLRAEVGEFVDGRWRSYADLSVDKTADGPRLTLDDATARSLVLVYEPGARDEAVLSAERLLAP